MHRTTPEAFGKRRDEKGQVHERLAMPVTGAQSKQTETGCAPGAASLADPHRWLVHIAHAD
jgi:hypothetical protein